jgi:hypothetical protein
MDDFKAGKCLDSEMKQTVLPHRMLSSMTPPKEKNGKLL